MPASQQFDFCRHHVASQHYFEVAHTARPPGARTQWLSFVFRSEAMQRHSPASHFAVVLNARLGRDAAGVPCSISGRGLTLGDTSQATRIAGNAWQQRPGFGGARGAQVESFWPGGNFLYREAQLLPEGLQDEVDYRIHLHVNDQRWIAFWLADAEGRPLPGQQVCVQDAADHPLVADASGVVIALGRGPESGGAWQASFRDIRYGWCN